MNEFVFTPAKRENVSLLIALAGASGSGKTKSALRIAQGISPTGKIAFIDTEARRGLHYADDHVFIHADMRPPFRPERFLAAIHAAEAAGAEVVIIDSFSNEYDGEDGITDWAEALERAGTKSPGNWLKPKQAHKKMMNAILQCRASIIFCLRADEKIKISKENGKNVVTPLGWMPICEKRFMFDMTVSFTLTPGEQRGRIRYDLPHKAYDLHRAIFPEGAVFNEEAGARMAAWAQGDMSGLTGTVTLLKEGEAEAEKGMATLEAFWKARSVEEKRALGGKAKIDAWKSIANRADKGFDDHAFEDSSEPMSKAGAGPDWPHELEFYAGDLGELEDIAALDARIKEDGARFTDAPADVRADATKLEAAERARVERAAP